MGKKKEREKINFEERIALSSFSLSWNRVRKD